MSTSYTIPALVLAFGAGMLALVTSKAQKNLDEKNAILADLTTQISQISSGNAIRKQVLKNMEQAAAPGNAFIETWKTHLVPGKDGNSILADFVSVGTSNIVSIQNRKSGTGEIVWRNLPAPLNYAQGTVVSGDYYRLMNWLGEIEQTWPLAHIDSCALKQTGNSLSLGIKMSYPSFIVEKLAK
jgi:hypothetical protein